MKEIKAECIVEKETNLIPEIVGHGVRFLQIFKEGKNPFDMANLNEITGKKINQQFVVKKCRILIDTIDIEEPLETVDANITSSGTTKPNPQWEKSNLK